MPFRNPLALLGLLSIIPLIIIYLIQPRPKEILFSSILFLRESETERSAVLSRLISDPLFWIQLLVLCSLSVGAAGPYTTEEGLAGTHLAIVLDGSASMQNSFDAATTIIDPYLDHYEKIDIVFAESIPITALTSGSSSEARDTLQRLQPKALSADLSSAMMLGNNLLGSDGGDILVVSDFISWTGDDPGATRKFIEAEGKTNVVFSDTYKGGDNVALVGGWDISGPEYINHTALIHNFGPDRSVTITLTSPSGSTGQTENLARDQDFYLTFKAFPGVNEISLDLDDSINWDNHAYVYVPEQGQKKILYLGEKGPSFAALQSLPNVNVQTSGDYDSYDLVIVSKNGSLDGKLNRFIDGGGKVIYIATSPDESPEFLPVRAVGSVAGPANLWVRNEGFAEGLHFDEIGLFSYLDSEPRRHSTVLVETNGAPVLAYWRLGKGLVVYDGLEFDSDFYLRPEYPLFWYQMVNWASGIPKINDVNRKTGELIPLGEQVDVETPSGTINTANLLLDEVGIYKSRGNTISANMYDPSESSLTRNNTITNIGEFSGIARESNVEKDLSGWLMALAILAIFAEFLLLRKRRET